MSGLFGIEMERRYKEDIIFKNLVMADTRTNNKVREAIQTIERIMPGLTDEIITEFLTTERS